MTEETLSALFGPTASFAKLQTVCIKRAPELNPARLADLVKAAPSLVYLRSDGLGPAHVVGLKRSNRKLTVKLD